MLKFIVDTLEEVPEAQRELYVEKDGKFVLDVEGVPEDPEVKKRIDEFRENNIKLFQKAEEMEKQLKKFEGVDPDEYKKALDLLEKYKDSKLLDDGKIEELLNERTGRMKQDFQNKIDALTEKLGLESKEKSTLRTSLGILKIDNAIQQTILRLHKIKSGAMPDIIRRGREVFKLSEELEPVAIDSNGGKMVGKDGITPLTIEEWAEQLPNEAAHCFEDGEGLHSKGKGGKTGGSQMDRIKKIADPQERLKAARRAGVS